MLIEGLVTLFFVGVPLAMGGIFLSVFAYIRTAALADSFIEARKEVYGVAHHSQCELSSDIWMENHLSGEILTVNKHCGDDRFDGKVSVTVKFLGFSSSNETNLLGRN